MRVCLALVLVVAATAVFAAPAAADTPIPECTTPVTARPCVVSITKNPDTTPVTLHLEDALLQGHEVIGAYRYTLEGGKNFHFFIFDENGLPDLNPADLYEFVLNTGSVRVEETFARGRHVEVTTSMAGGDHIVTFRMNPVPMSYTDSGCGPSGTSCGDRADYRALGALEGTANDLGYVTDPFYFDAMRGNGLASSADFITTPPDIDFATHTFRISAANSHCVELTGPTCTPFEGSIELTMPFAMLHNLYDVDDPASLTRSAFLVSGAGSAATTIVTVDDAGHLVHVDISGITFSKRRLKVVGDMRPGPVRNLHAVRVSGTRGKLKFDPAESRGSRVRGYAAKCKSDSGLVASGSADASPVKVSGLSAGVKYRCTVWAKSRFGDGRKRGADMPRH